MEPETPRERLGLVGRSDLKRAQRGASLFRAGCRRPAKSNRLVCQEVATVGFQALPVFTMLLSTVSSFRIQAVRASFLGFPAARRRW